MAADLPFVIAFDSKGKPKVVDTEKGRKVAAKPAGTSIAELSKGKQVRNVFNISVTQISGSCIYVVQIGGEIYQIVIPNATC